MTEFLQDFHFLRPWWLVALVPVILLTVFVFKKQQESGQWQNLIAPHLLPFLLDNAEKTQRRYWSWVTLLLWLVALTALAGPAWKKLPEPVEQDTAALVIVWDLSMSMLAKDIKPSRVDRSRLKIIDLLESRKEGLTGLITYSGEAYTVAPLTDDVDTIANLLPALNPTILPSRGSNIEMAYAMANQLFNKAGVPTGDILLITDEIHTTALEFLAEEVKASAHQLTLWGVGTKEGAPIPLQQGGFARRNGNLIVAKLNENQLQQFASHSSSYYVPMVQTDTDISTIEQLLNKLKNSTEKTKRVFDQWFEHGQYLCLFLLVALAFGFRKGWLMAWFIALPLTLTPGEPAQALEWQTLFKTPDQQAQSLLDEGDAVAAANTFKDPQWRATAHYKAENYEAAASGFAGSDGLNSLYNQATSLTRLGQYDDAIKQFDKVLQTNPDFAAAQQNKSIAEQLKELQEQQNQDQQQSQDQQSDNQEKQDQQQNQDQNSQQNGEDQNQNSSDSQNANNQQSPQDDPSNNQQQANTEESNEKQKEEGEEQKTAEQKAKEAEQKATENEQIQSQALVDNDQKPQSEEEQMLEQWLRKVPDDPSGLLRNKFAHQYRERQRSVRTNRNFLPNSPREERF